MTRIMGQDYTDTDNDDGDQGKKTNGEEMTTMATTR